MSQKFCTHLRTKKMFTGATVEEAFAAKHGEHTTPCHCWCNRTQTVVGPDDEAVHQEACNPSRTCFEE